MQLFGREMTRREVQARTGRMEQVAGIRLAELGDGKERGVRIADVRTGGGLRFSVLLDRGLDLGDAEFAGIPLAYYAPGEFAHPAYFDDDGAKWLRNWGAGWLSGCGLRNVGAPGDIEGEGFPVHGRLSNTPARNLSIREEWQGDQCVLVIEGEVYERRLFGEKLVLRRRISARVGGAEVRIRDTVENQGFSPEPVFLLYHTNWGFPVVDETAVLQALEHPVEPRDKTAAAGLDAWDEMQPPTPGYEEQVFYHDIPADSDGFFRIHLRNPRLGILAEVAARKAELPRLVQWKMMGQGEYVTGLEPSNCRVGGRAEELAAGPHCVLEGGESRTFEVRLRVARPAHS